MKHFLLWGGGVTHTSSSECDESRANNKFWNIFFSVFKMRLSGAFDEFEADEYRGATVCGTDVDTRRNCIYVHNGETSDLYTLDIER